MTLPCWNNNSLSLIECVTCAVGHGSRSIVSFLDSVCVRCVQKIRWGRAKICVHCYYFVDRPGNEEEVFTSLLHTNLANHPFFPPPKNIDKKDKFKVKHYARVVTYTVGTFITRNMDVRLPELEEVLFSSTHNAKCGLFYDVSSKSPLLEQSTDDHSDNDGTNPIADSTGDGNSDSTEGGRQHRTGSMSRVDFIKQKFKEVEGPSSLQSASPPRPVSMSLSLSDVDKASPTAGALVSPAGRCVRMSLVWCSVISYYPCHRHFLCNVSPRHCAVQHITDRAGGKKAYTVAGSFVRSMHGLTKTLSSTKCSFIRSEYACMQVSVRLMNVVATVCGATSTSMEVVYIFFVYSSIYASLTYW